MIDCGSSEGLPFVRVVKDAVRRSFFSISLSRSDVLTFGGGGGGADPPSDPNALEPKTFILHRVLRLAPCTTVIASWEENRTHLH